jgi:hypothetical protein
MKYPVFLYLIRFQEKEEKRGLKVNFVFFQKARYSGKTRYYNSRCFAQTKTCTVVKQLLHF